jgi:hypothetical protein
MSLADAPSWRFWPPATQRAPAKVAWFKDPDGNTLSVTQH